MVYTVLILRNNAAREMRGRMQVFELLPDDPVVNLCIGVGYLLHSITRIVGDRNSCILKAFAFLTRYAARSANSAEAAYNMGRAFQHLEINNLAVEWYDRCLEIAMKDKDGSMKRQGANLQFECGHNLALIYEGSGATELAHRIRFHHCSV